MCGCVCVRAHVCVRGLGHITHHPDSGKSQSQAHQGLLSACHPCCRFISVSLKPVSHVRSLEHGLSHTLTSRHTAGEDSFSRQKHYAMQPLPQRMRTPFCECGVQQSWRRESEREREKSRSREQIQAQHWGKTDTIPPLVTALLHSAHGVHTDVCVERERYRTRSEDTAEPNAQRNNRSMDKPPGMTNNCCYVGCACRRD